VPLFLVILPLKSRGKLSDLVAFGGPRVLVVELTCDSIPDILVRSRSSGMVSDGGNGGQWWAQQAPANLPAQATRKGKRGVDGRISARGARIRWRRGRRWPEQGDPTLMASCGEGRAGGGAGVGHERAPYPNHVVMLERKLEIVDAFSGRTHKCSRSRSRGIHLVEPTITGRSNLLGGSLTALDRRNADKTKIRCFGRDSSGTVHLGLS
jgi:hypothetical protein